MNPRRKRDETLVILAVGVLLILAPCELLDEYLARFLDLLSK